MFVQPRKKRCLLQPQLQPQSPPPPKQQQPDSDSSLHLLEEVNLAGTSEAPSSAQPIPLFRAANAGRKSHQCRTCGLQLSSASNRLRHERAKHKSGASEAAAASQSDQPAELSAAADDAELATAALAGLPYSNAEADSEPRADESDQLVTASESAQLQAIAAEVEGFQPMLQESELQTSCYPFLQWLSLPPLTSCEALVKARRVKSLTQLQPIKCNLRFIFAVLYESAHIQSVDLNDLSRVSTCQALFEALNQRSVGSGRFHAVFLLIKKVLVYLTSQESIKRRQFLQPTMHDSFMYVDSICSDSSYKRKQETRNRAVLGVQATQALSRGQPQRAPAVFQVPTVWSATSTEALPRHGVATAAASREDTPAAVAAAARATHENGSMAEPVKAAVDREVAAPAPELSKEELQQVTKGCLSYLQSSIDAAEAASSSTNRATLDRLYMAHLVTATLCLGLAPRSQVLKQLRLGSSFTKEAADGLYWVKMLANMSKNGKPTTFAIPAQLTAAFDFYLETIRPRLIGQLLPLPEGETAHDYIFVKHNGSAPRSDFSSCTNLVTQRLIGRPINAHAFRTAVVTAYYQAGASQSEMDTLASIMAHDPATARNFYFRPQFNQAAMQANDKMTELLLH
jgi:integrase